MANNARIGITYIGGSCGHQASLAIMTVLKSDKAAELVTLTKKDEPYVKHTFVIIGRAPDSNLSDPSTWGNNAVLVDYYANGKALTANELLADRKQYAYLFNNIWRWNSEIYRHKLIRKGDPKIQEACEYIKTLNKHNPKNLENFSNYIQYCNKKIKEIINSIKFETVPTPTRASTIKPGSAIIG